MKKYIYLFLAGLLTTQVAFSQIDRNKQPAPGPAPKVNLTKPQSFTLDNGLTVMVVENHKLPTVRLQLLIDNPPHASGEKAGVESLFSAMMGNGTTSISKDDFNEEVDYLGASIFFGQESAYANSLSEYFPRILELMADAIKNPIFAKKEFDKEQDKLIEGLRSQERSVTDVSNRVRPALIFGKNHPKGEFTTIEKVEKITLNDVENFYDNFFNPRNAYLVVVGDVKRADVEQMVREHLSDWEAKAVPSVKYTNPQDVQYTQVNFVDMPNAVQSEIGVAHLVDLKMDHPDYFPILIANRILGGGFNSLLNMNLREKHGWTYGAYSHTGADKYITQFIAATSVRNAVTDSAVVEMLKEIHFIRENKVTIQQLNNAKAKFTGDFVLALERPQTIANYALRVETQNLPSNFYVDYLRKITAVTAEDLERVAKKYYKPENLRIIVVGKGSEVLDGLKNLENVNGKTIPVRYFDRFGSEIEEPSYEMDTDVTVEQVLENYINAIGGRQAVENVKTLKSTGSAEMQGMQLGLETINTTKEQFLMVISMGGQPMQKQVFDGNSGYNMSQGQRVDFTEEEIASTKINAVPFKELNAKNAKLLRLDQVDGKDAYVVTFGNSDTEAFYDKETGLLLQQQTTMEMMGQTMTSTIIFEDYQEVDGVKVPFTFKQAIGPQEITFKLDEVFINEGVSDDDFK